MKVGVPSCSEGWGMMASNLVVAGQHAICRIKFQEVDFATRTKAIIAAIPCR